MIPRDKLMTEFAMREVVIYTCPIVQFEATPDPDALLPVRIRQRHPQLVVLLPRQEEYVIQSHPELCSGDAESLHVALPSSVEVGVPVAELAAGLDDGPTVVVTLNLRGVGCAIKLELVDAGCASQHIMSRPQEVTTVLDGFCWGLEKMQFQQGLAWVCRVKPDTSRESSSRNH